MYNVNMYHNKHVFVSVYNSLAPDSELGVMYGALIWR